MISNPNEYEKAQEEIRILQKHWKRCNKPTQSVPRGSQKREFAK